MDLKPTFNCIIGTIFIVIILVFLIGFGIGKCFGSESPQRDLYKIDSRDWYFNHQGDYTINQPEYKARAKGSDGERLIRESDEAIKRIERNLK